MGVLQSGNGSILYGTNGLPIFANDIATTPRTLGIMQARIADDMVSDAITAAHITNVIQDAIRDHERAKFWFNHLYDSGNFSVTAGKHFYSPADYAPIGSDPHIETMAVTLSGNLYTLIPRTAEWMEQTSVNTAWQGLPTDYSWVGGVLRVYPTPDQTYPVTITGTFRWPMVANPNDSTPWMEEAEQLIRSRAKAALARHITRDMGMAQMMDGEEARALQLLRIETTRRMPGPGRIRIRGYF